MIELGDFSHLRLISRVAQVNRREGENSAQQNGVCQRQRWDDILEWPLLLIEIIPHCELVDVVSKDVKDARVAQSRHGLIRGW